MKRLFTLAIIAMIATLSFAQAPAQKMGGAIIKSENIFASAPKHFISKTEITERKQNAAKPAKAPRQNAQQQLNLTAKKMVADDYGTDAMVDLICDDYDVVFDIFYAEGEYEVTPGSYTADDMDLEYTYIASDEGYEDAIDATFNYTIDEDNLAHVIASMTTESFVVNVTYDEVPPVTHTWGAWEDFKPLGEATGSFTYNVMLSSGSTTINDLPVQVRYATDVENLAQVKVSNWGAGFLSAYGIDFIFEWNTADNTCVVPEQESGCNSEYGMVHVSDLDAYAALSYDNYPCTYNPETGTFSLCLCYYIPGMGAYGWSNSNGKVAETLVMDKPAAGPSGITHDIVITKNANWVDYVASQGWFQIYTTYKEYSASISTLSSPLNEGEFAKEDLDASYTYLKINGTAVAVADMHAKITNNDGVITGELWILDKESGDEYHVTMTHDPSQPVPLNYDEEDEVTYAFEASEITQNSATGNNKRTITFTAKNDTYQLALTMYASSKDADIVIPEGEYTVATTKAAGTVLASTGVSNSAVSRSYFATIDEEGYLDQLWFMTGGTVNVKKVYPAGSETAQVYMVIKATNSWGAEVNITVGEDDSTTTINNVNVVSEKTQKQLRNNQIVVVRNGVEYNTVGARLK